MDTNVAGQGTGQVGAAQGYFFFRYQILLSDFWVFRMMMATFFFSSTFTFFFFVLRIPDGILSVIYSVKISRATRAKCYWTLLYYYKTVLLTTITLVMLTRTTHMIFITCSSNIFFLFSTTY